MAATNQISEEQGCFLCEPEADLLAFEGDQLRVIAGLGPVVDGYHVVSAVAHVRSMADLLISDPSAIDTFVALRAREERALGPLLITEHGRVPLCRDDGDQHEQHCHHAHFLVFPGAPPIDHIVGRYYSHSTDHGTLSEALRRAASEETYLLVSPQADRYTIYSAPLNAPRQLTRTAVAFETGKLSLGDWRSNPAHSEAVAIATRLRKALI